MMRVENNISTFKWYYFLWRFKPLSALMIIYFIGITNSYAAGMGVFAVFNIIFSVVKIPGGIFSDYIGRKITLLLAGALLFISFILLALSGQYVSVSLLYSFACLWAISEAFINGTVHALMYETAQEIHNSENFKLIYSGSMIFDQLGCALGALAAMFVTYYVPLQILAWLTVIPAFLQLIASFFFVEPHIKIKKQPLNRQYVKIVISQFIKNKQLLFFSVADIFFSTLGDISHRFEGAYFKNFISNWMISLVRVLKHCFGILGFVCMPLLKKFSMAKIYFSSIFFNLIIRTIAVIFNNCLTPFFHMFINFFYATSSTAKTDILQKQFLPEYRATTNSIILFIKGLFTSLMMYLLGLAADIYGIYSAMITLVVLRIIGLFVAFVFQKAAKQA